MLAKTKNGKFNEKLTRIMHIFDVKCSLYDLRFNAMVHPRNIINNAMSAYQLTGKESKLYMDEKDLSGRIILSTPISSFCRDIMFQKKEGKISYNLKSRDIIDFLIMMISEFGLKEAFVNQDIPYELCADEILSLILLDLRAEYCEEANAEIEIYEGEVIEIRTEIGGKQKDYTRRKI